MAKEETVRKEKGELVQATIPKAQKEIITDVLIGKLGTNESDVIGKIISMWFYDQEWYRELIKNKIER